MTTASLFEQCLNRLTRDRHRVWSLIVTLFGDMAYQDGDQVSTQVLAKITDPMGVKPEALRVALHRLRKDGWIDSTRQGRSSVYRLTGFGRKLTLEAAPRIYGQTSPDTGNWCLFTASTACEDSGRDLEDLSVEKEMVQLGPNLLLGRCPQDGAPSSLLVSRVDPSSVPEWVKSRACPDELCESYRALEQSLLEVSSLLPDDLNPLECAVLRCLIVHSWRRVLLRHPEVPDALYPSSCPAVACRELAMTLLERLPRPSLDKL